MSVAAEQDGSKAQRTGHRLYGLVRLWRESLTHPFRQIGHDLEALLLGQPEPAPDFLPGPAAALAEARFRVEGADSNAGRGSAVHDGSRSKH